MDNNFKENDFFEIESDDGIGGIVKYDITTSPAEWNPSNIVELIDEGILELPMFQRNFVWDKKRASKLIESIILGLPVPEIFVYYENEQETYKIIDGQQRLLSIYFYMKGRFPKSLNSRILIKEKMQNKKLSDVLASNKYFDTFSLTLEDDKSNQSRYNNISYENLPADMKLLFKLRRYLRVIKIRQNSPDDDNSSMFEIFNRLNTGGIKLENQEIRASLYYCNFYNMLIELNEFEKWRSMLGKSSQDLHGTDIELILRSFAMLEKNESYSPKMVNFLNSYSQTSMNFDNNKIEYLRSLFISFLGSCSSLDTKAFFKNNKFSKTLFESVFVAVCSPAYKTQDILVGKINADSFYLLKNDKLLFLCPNRN